MSASNSPHQRSLRRSAFAGVCLIALFAGTIGVWSATGNVAGAVIAPGQLVAASDLRKVQHPTGGVVGELLVRNGDFVEEGQLLIRLDDTVTRANLQVVAKQMDELTARRARLEAELRDDAGFDAPAEFAERGAEPEIAALVASERRLLEARRSAREGQKNQLRKRVSQLHDEIAGLKAQQAAKAREAEIIERELVGVRDLYGKQLVQMMRLSSLEREATTIEGERGRLLAAVAQAEGRIAETELQIIQIDEELRANALKELRETQSRLGELAERRIAAEDQLKRVNLRSPVAGFVHQLAVHTVGGVITPAEPAMYVVPRESSYAVETRVAPPDIDQISVGQSVRLRVAAGNRRTTPEIDGVVSRISADVSQDKATGAPFYSVRVDLAAGAAEALGLRLQPGMQAEAYIRTGDRTPLAYLLKPLDDQIARSFRER
ncbi:MAG TPA: HlyD family type I secretion periplasmic adaptor subunit [Beijerinckiaceae bacterium]